MAGVARLQPGAPGAGGQQPNFNAFAGLGSQRPNRIGDPRLPAARRTTSRYFDNAAFATAPRFTLGNSPRHPVSGSGWQTLDLMLGRVFTLSENLRFEVRAQSFNMTNTPPWGEPNGSFGSASFGSITSAGNPRGSSSPPS